MRDISGVVHFAAIALPLLDGTRAISMDRAVVTGNFFDVLGVRPVIGRLLRLSDDDVELLHAQTMGQLLAEPLAQPRFSATLMSGFGLVALILAALGLYGVMTAMVRDQTRELGIRIALGATSANVRGEVMRRAGIVVVAGAIVGLIGALSLPRLLSTLLFRVSPTDPLALGGASLVLLAAGTLAAYLPARRATKIDPVEALRASEGKVAGAWRRACSAT
ncbi:MAG: FtsX-like permease family protein [Gemmatimonadaceae bacterium]